MILLPRLHTQMMIDKHPHARSATLPSARSEISGLKLLWRMLRLLRSRPLLPRPQINLNLTLPGGLLHLQQCTIALSRNKLSDVHLEHAQVMGHMILLRYNKLRT